MIRDLLTPRRSRILFAPAMVVALAVLAVLATGRANVRRESLRVPDNSAVALLKTGQSVCEGPVAAGGDFDAVEIFGGPVLPIGGVRVDVHDAGTHATLASGITDLRSAGEHVIALERTVPAGRRVRVCVTSTLNTFSLDGSSASAPGVQMTGGKQTQFSLGLVSRDRSLLAALPTAFARASLFKLSWMGAWTFWVLLVALAGGAIGLGALAIASAGAEDEHTG